MIYSINYAYKCLIWHRLNRYFLNNFLRLERRSQWSAEKKLNVVQSFHYKERIYESHALFPEESSDESQFDKNVVLFIARWTALLYISRTKNCKPHPNLSIK